MHKSLNEDTIKIVNTKSTISKSNNDFKEKSEWQEIKKERDEEKKKKKKREETGMKGQKVLIISQVRGDRVGY